MNPHSDISPLITSSMHRSLSNSSCKVIIQEIKNDINNISYFTSESNSLNLNKDADDHSFMILSRSGLIDKINSMEFHKKSIEELVIDFSSNIFFGLTEVEARERFQTNKSNILPKTEKKKNFYLFLSSFFNMFQLLLWISAVLTTIKIIVNTQVSNFQLIIQLSSILMIIFITGILSTMQNRETNKFMDKIEAEITRECIVKRDGQLKQIDSQFLVPGDIVEIQQGNIIPADIRIIECNLFKVDSINYNGETLALVKNNLISKKENIMEASNIILKGSICIQGSCKGIVFLTGQNTILGLLMDLTINTKKREFALKKDLKRFSILISFIAVVLSLSFSFIDLIFVNKTLMSFLFLGNNLIIANIPEGLLLCIALSINICAFRLKNKNVFVKQLPSIDTLGLCNVLCFDKTGTLTENEMKVTNIWINYSIYCVRNGQNLNILKLKIFQLLNLIATLTCTSLYISENYRRNEKFQSSIKNSDYFIGDSTENGILTFFLSINKFNKNTENIIFANTINKGEKALIPFESERKYSLAICKKGKKLKVFIKGEPNTIGSFCNKILVDDNLLNFSNFDHTYTKDLKYLTDKGERPIAFAFKELDSKKYPLNFEFNLENLELEMNEFIMVGLISLIDPPKKEINIQIRKLKETGVSMTMITGDNLNTARELANKINFIQDSQNATLITGKEFNLAVKNQELELLKSWLSKKEIIFAEVGPECKSLIVGAYIEMGNAVAFIGDGINDAPAIKKADIGISLGIKSSAATQEIADIVLLDDQLSGVYTGIYEGRKLFENLRKTIVYMLTSNCTEVMPIIISQIFSIPMPITSLFMIFISAVSDIFPALSLSFEEGELNIMKKEPRNRKERLVPFRLIIIAYLQMGFIATLCGLYAFLMVMNDCGFSFQTLIGTNNMTGYFPKATDYFNLNLKNFGNSNLPETNCLNWSHIALTNTIQWSDDHSNLDLRLFLIQCDIKTNLWVQSKQFLDNCNFLDKNACFRIESVYYARSAYFSAIIFIQITNLLICRSKLLPFYYAGIRNWRTLVGIMWAIMIGFLVCFTHGMNKLLGARQLWKSYFFAPAIPFSIFLLLWDEFRKFLIRNSEKLSKSNFLGKYLYW